MLQIIKAFVIIFCLEYIILSIIKHLWAASKSSILLVVHNRTLGVTALQYATLSSTVISWSFALLYVFWTKSWLTVTRGFIPRKIQWHIHTGMWSLVNWWQEALMRHYIRGSWILMRTAVSLEDGLSLDGDRCISVIPQHPPFHMKEEALPVCKETITLKYMVVLKGLSLQQIWMYYKETLTKNLAELNTFKTSMSLGDQVKSYNWTLLRCLFTYIHTALKWLRGAKVLQVTLVEVSQWCFLET